MNAFTALLKILSVIFAIVSVVHLCVGPSAELLLGADLSARSMADPVLDSQNRFYGVAFILYAALIYLCATDLPKYSTVFKLVLACFFAAGLARLISIYLVGWPTGLILFLLASELLLPIILYFSFTLLTNPKS